MTVVGYIRVSTGDQFDSGHGLRAQRAALEAAYPGAQVFAETGSGKSLDRPVLLELLAALEPDDLLVVARLDRLTRSLKDFADLLERASREGWRLVALDLGLDTSTPQGEMMASVLAAFAQYERRLISQRTKDGLAAARAAGVRLGRPQLVTARQTARIMDLYDRGLSLTSIAEELNERGLTPVQGGSRWWPSTVSKVVRRELAKAES